MRVLGGLGLAVIIASALIVPLPWAAQKPTEVLQVRDVVTVTSLPPPAGAPAPPEPRPLTGSYLATHPQAGRSALAVLGGVASSGRVVVRTGTPPDNVLAQPGTIAALRGLGLSPARMEGAVVPVRVEISDAVDPYSLAALLHIFDTTSQLDVARRRRVAAIGRVVGGESLRCVAAAADAIEAAREAGADVVVVPTDCDEVPRGRGTVRATTFLQAVERLLAR
jgi:PDZ domain-containing secreted protein